MAPGDENNLIEAVVTCEGNLHDPNFSERFQILLGNLKTLLREDDLVKVKKIEPWNSVRITITIPKEAAQKLKLLAQQGSHVLKSLGILTVQVDGDQVISLTIAGQNNQSTELILRQDGTSSSSHLALQQQSSCVPPHGPVGLISSSSFSSAFVRSPNVVAPPGESIPVLPPKSTASTFTPHSSLGLGGPFPFASMAHAAQTMQRTDHPNNSSGPMASTSTTNSINSSTSSVINKNHQAVNSTNSPNVPSAIPTTTTSNSSLVAVTQITTTTLSFPHNQNVSSSSLSNSRLAVNSSSQQVGGGAVGALKSEELMNRFTLQQNQAQGEFNSSLNLNPPSQSLQLQIVNAPPPYPGVNSGIGSTSDSNANFNLNPSASSNLGGNLNNVNQHPQLNLKSANLQGVDAVEASQSRSFAGAPFPLVVSSSSSNVTLVRSVSSPAMTSSTQQQHMGVMESTSLLGSSSHHQPMSSPLLVNLLQNNEVLGGNGGSLGSGHSQGFVNIMLPPGSSLEQKKLILAQHLQARKAKRGLSLEGASLEIGTPSSMSGSELTRPLSTDVVGRTPADRASPALLHPSQNNSMDNSSNNNNNSLTQITLPSSIPPSSSSDSSNPSTMTRTAMTSVPISVGQPRPSSDLSTTATILQGRTIIHEGNVRVFNPGQIRAIRLTQTTTSPNTGPTTQYIQGKPVITTTLSPSPQTGSGKLEGAVQLNGPYNNNSSSFQTPATPPQCTGLISSTISSCTITTPSSLSAMSTGGIKLESKLNNSVLYSADQSSRTFMDNMSINAATTSLSATTPSPIINRNISHNTSLSNMFIPPSSEHTNAPSSNTTNFMRLSTIPTPIPQERQAQSAVQVQSQEAKLFPSHHHHQYVHQKGPNSSNTSKLLSSAIPSGKPRQLINPLTGHLEPMLSESGSDSDEDGGTHTKKTKGSRKIVQVKGIAGGRQGAIQHRQIVTTTTTGVTVARVLKSVGGSDSQKFVTEDRKHSLHQNCLTVVPVTISSVSATSSSNVQQPSRKSSRDEGVVDMGLATITSNKDKNPMSMLHNHAQGMEQKRGPAGEKIKLRLKLGKNEPISPAYKVDVSFVKKSEKSSVTPTTLPSSSGASFSTSANSVNPNPSGLFAANDQPRVPPLHISLRGKNAAVVVSSPRREEDTLSPSPISFMDGIHKPSGILGKSGKRTKSRVKSSGIESDPENLRQLKAPKLSRQRLSKDSNTTTSTEWDGVVRPPDSLKSRLEPPLPGGGQSFQAMTTTTNVNVKDLILSESKTTTSKLSPSISIPSPTVKLKNINERRASDSEVRIGHQQVVTSLGIRSVESNMLSLSDKLTSSLLDSSSLLFQHLSKKEDNPSVTGPVVSLAVTSIAPPTLSASVTHVQVSNTTSSTSSTSVLTLTSTATGATISTAKGISATDVVRITTALTSTSSTSTTVSDIAKPRVNADSDPTMSGIIPTKLIRDNIPKPLNISKGEVKIMPGTSENVRASTPTSRSPNKPVPDLLALTLPTITSPVEDKMNSPPDLTPLTQTPSFSGLSSDILLPANSLEILTTASQLTPPPVIEINPSTILKSNDEICVKPPTTSTDVYIQSQYFMSEVQSRVPEKVNLLKSSSEITAPTPIPRTSPTLANITQQPVKSSLPNSTFSHSKPNPILRSKKQAPKVSIGTSIDSELSSLTPSPSLRELLEKEKEDNLLSVKNAVCVPKHSIDINKMVASKLSEIVPIIPPPTDCRSHDSFANHSQDTQDFLTPDAIPAELTMVETKSCPTNLNPGVDTVAVKIAEETLDNSNLSNKQVDVVPEMSEECFPSTSTVTPNAPLPFPLVLAKAEDPTGVPGEDSGIDSMDALSEKSPNQGESPARKDAEQYGEAHHSLPSCGGPPSMCRTSPKLESEPNPTFSAESQKALNERTEHPIESNPVRNEVKVDPVQILQNEILTSSFEDVEVKGDVEEGVQPQPSNSTEIVAVLPPETDDKVTNPEKGIIKTEEITEAMKHSFVGDKVRKADQQAIHNETCASTVIPTMVNHQEILVGKLESAVEGSSDLLDTKDSAQHIMGQKVHVIDSINTEKYQKEEDHLLETEQEQFTTNFHPPSMSPIPVITNHLDAIQELHQLPVQIPKPSIIHNAKFRRAKLENIVAAIGTKNIGRQQTKVDTFPFVVDNLSATDAVEENLEEMDQSTTNISSNISSTLGVGSTIDARIQDGMGIPVLAQEHPLPDPPIVAPDKDLEPAANVCVSTLNDGLEPPRRIYSPITNEQNIIMPPCHEVLAIRSLPPVLETEETLSSRNLEERHNQPPKITSIPTEDAATDLPPKLISSVASATEPIDTATQSFPPKLVLPHSVCTMEPPPSISVALPSRPTSPQKPVLEPQTSQSKSKPRAKINRRGQDKPPKLSKATETDPRPESANPPRLEMGAELHAQSSDSSNIEAEVSIPPAVRLIQPNPHKFQNLIPSQQSGLSIGTESSPPPEPFPISVSLASATAGPSLHPQHRSHSHVVQPSKVIPIPNNSNVSRTISPMGAITVPLQSNPACTSPVSAQTMFAIHPNMAIPANLQLHQTYGQSSITVLPGGQKIVPVKLVTIPRQSSNQFQTIPLSARSHNSSSPNLLEPVNIVTNANSRSNSPKTIVGNQLHTSGSIINLNSVSLPGSGNIQLVPISMASSVGGSSNPVKVLVSQPVKLGQSIQHSQQQQLNVKSGITSPSGAHQTIRVIRPADGGMKNIAVVTTKPEQSQPHKNIPQTLPPLESVPKASPSSSSQSVQIGIVDHSKLAESNSKVLTSPAESQLSTINVSKAAEFPSTADSKSVHKRVVDLEVLDSESNQINDDDLPLEADIIHDLKDLEDVLAGESIETQENGIDSPYDFTIEEKLPEKYQGGLRKHYEKDIHAVSNKIKNNEPSTDANSSPDSPIPMIRSSSPPLYTYGNRSSKTSSRSPSPTDSSDIHGEDQEIIDSFIRSRSPSQPRLSPQNKLIKDHDDEHHSNSPSPMKPDLTAFQERNLSELSIEIPPVDIMSENQHQNPSAEERKPARSTRSNTRLVSPDITAFRSDTPKLTKFSSKPDPLVLRSSPKPSPTGSFKILSPTVSSGLTLTPSSSNRSSPISLGGSSVINTNHTNCVTSAVLEKISGHLSNNTVSTKGSSTKATNSKRKRQESDSSSASKDENNEEKTEIDLNSRPGKRRCSENAAELIKACIGVEDTPKRNSMLIKRMEESNKLKEAKLKKAMATLVEETEDDNESVESVLSRGRGRSSRASSEDDRSSSRGSSVQRNIGTSKTSKEEEISSNEQKTSKNNPRPGGKDKQKEIVNQNSLARKKDSKKQSSNLTSAKRVSRNVPTSVKEKSPLTPAKTRTNVGTEKSSNATHALGLTPTPQTPHSALKPELENLRRKTRSTAASKRYGETSDAELAALKRRRISKDTKS